ncbi:hypothetical protein J5X98_22990 [Leptothermofonsia sichuanensis E412]|jgi:hypothetical protein|nr:hypothetical protein [Leptothermofonsia sichuanensis]QZZ20113.1 hypothetical protein J5X98_22990 [Leptothermofonsia sichuanensis E412]
MATEDERKKRVMEHLARSTGDFIKRPTSIMSPDRKRQVMDHVRLTSS